ncbi:unnamed protein product, partial [Prorocentrum cordatum]
AGSFDRKLATSKTCRRCTEGRGTLRHRHFACNAAEHYRRDARPKVTQAWMMPHERPEKDEVRWVARPPEGVFRGTVFVDASATDPTDEILRRAGWTIVQHSGGGQVTGAARGTAPLAWAPMQLARDGEDHVFHFVQGCAHSGLEVEVNKVKAHKSKADCVTETERWAREGNEQADLLAKGAHFLAKQTARWIAQSQVLWQDQVEDVEGTPKELWIELEEMPPDLQAAVDAGKAEKQQLEKVAKAEAATEVESKQAELEPIIVWEGHHLREHRCETGERGLTCRRRAANGVQGRTQVKQRRKELLFQECREKAKGCKEHLRRQRKGLHPVPCRRSSKCDSLEGIASGLRQELAEVVGEQQPAAEEELEAPRQVTAPCDGKEAHGGAVRFKPLADAAKAHGTDEDGLVALGRRARAAKAEAARSEDACPE